MLSLLPLANMRLSADHATWYTGPTCPLKVARNVPLRPSHSFTDLSNEADRMYRPSGEKHTCSQEHNVHEGADSQGHVVRVNAKVHPRYAIPNPRKPYAACVLGWDECTCRQLWGVQ